MLLRLAAEIAHPVRLIVRRMMKSYSRKSQRMRQQSACPLLCLQLLLLLLRSLHRHQPHPQSQHALQAADCLRALRAFNNLSEDEKDAFEEWVDENASVSASDVTESKPYASLRLPCTASTPAPSVAAALPNEPESATKAFFQVH